MLNVVEIGWSTWVFNFKHGMFICRMNHIMEKSTTISITKAEMVAASEGAREIVWLKRLFQQIIQLRSISIIIVGNETAIKLGKIPELHRRMNYIRIRYFFIWELVMANKISFRKIDTYYKSSGRFDDKDTIQTKIADAKADEYNE